MTGAFMNRAKLWVVLGLLLTWMGSAWAGGVSGGGGDVEKYPSEAKQVVGAARRYAGKILTAWLQSEERWIKETGLPEDHPLKPIFKSQRNVFEVLKSVKVNLAMSQPCFDDQGMPHDGSANLSGSDEICISPYAMFPKLSIFNVNEETVALILHEVSHLLGANEAEADAAQFFALYAFHGTDFRNVENDIWVLSGGIINFGFPPAFEVLRDWIRRPRPARTDMIEHWSDIFYLKLKEDFSSTVYSYVSFGMQKMFEAQDIRTSNLSYYSCSVDLSKTKATRDMCAEHLEEIFGRDVELSAREYAIRSGYSDPGEVYDSVKIKRIYTTDGFHDAVQALYDDYESVWSEVIELNKFTIKTVSMP
jgi:hypothetical protein